MALSSTQTEKEPSSELFYDRETHSNTEETLRDAYRRMVFETTLVEMKQVKV